MSDGSTPSVDLSDLPYGPGETPGAAPKASLKPDATGTSVTVAQPPPQGSVDLSNLPYKPGETPGGAGTGSPTSTPLDQPLPGFFNRPAGQSPSEYMGDLWSYVIQGFSQSAADKARIIGDTYTYGQGDRLLSQQLTGPALEAERQKTADAWKREGVMAPFDAAVGYGLPGPSWLTAARVPGAIAGKALPLINDATGVARTTAAAAVPAINKAIARVAGYAGESGLTSALQDVGHGIYDPLTVAGDTAIGTTVGAAAHGVNEAVASGASKLRDWWRGGAPSGTPSEIAHANPNNPAAQQFAEWHENIARGNTPSPGDIGNICSGSRLRKQHGELAVAAR